MIIERRYIVQDRESRMFLGRDFDADMTLIPFINCAHLFDAPDEAALNGLAICSEGYLIFALFVGVGE